MGGKTSTSTSQVSVPPEVLARYNAANSVAQSAAGVTYGTNADGSTNYSQVTGMKPFQQYGGQFVAPVNGVEQGGIDQINNWYRDDAQQFIPGAMNDIGQSYAQAAGYINPALGAVGAGANAAQGLYNGSTNTGQTGVSQGTGLLNSGVATMQQAAGQAAGMYGGADTNYLVAANEGQQGLANATPWIKGAYGQAMPGMGAAQGLIGSGLSSGQGYANQAQGFLGGATAAVNPGQIDQSQINRYMSPYLNNVVQSEMGLLNQQNAQQQSALKGNAISSGAWGGDRAGIAQANLAQQQSLANNQILSGLLNQGYQNALGTAQQQQGVDLAAQQANRQAQQFGEGASAALGQQQYAQNLGASNAYQQLGQNMFNLNMNQGNALAGLGQQAYNMRLGVAQGQAGLGSGLGSLGAQNAGVALNAGQGTNAMYQGLAGLQQGAAQGLYNVGQGLGQFNLAAGQQVFNQGQQAGANWMNLGLQGQNAGIQGSQAAIQAGQVAQQTQQAQDTALYNQFQQQQGYPFQVAQFLANVAEGTGSLSGSTTTTTQPAPWWSDERLKTDIARIGKADDGTPIYRFRYKNDPSNQPHIGLIAQDVEKKHPEAVGLHNGYRTLDYDKLPAREGRAFGGPLTTVSQTVGYDPSSGGLVPSASGLAPYRGGLGRSGYVPSPNLPVGQLQVAKPVGDKPEPMLKGLINTGTSALTLGKDLKSGYDMLKASGGLVRGYDDGGDVEPYQDDDNGYMGDVMRGMKPPHQLKSASPSNSNSQSNPLSDIASAVGTAKTLYGLGSGVMSFLPALALRSGGLVRQGYDDGGDVIPAPDTGDDQMVRQTPDTLDKIVRAVGHVESTDRPWVTGPATRTGDRAYGQYQVMGANIPSWSKQVLGREMTPQEFLNDPEAQHAIARAKLGEYYNKYGNADDAASMWFSGHPLAGNQRSDGFNTTPQYVSKFRQAYEAAQNDNADLPAPNAQEASAHFLPGMSSGLVNDNYQSSQPQGQSSGLMGNIGNLLSGNGWSGNGDNRLLLSLLSGLGSMASSNSRYLGASILQGLGGGAKTYADLTKQQADIAKETLGLANQMFTPIPNKPGYFRTMSGDVVDAGQRNQIMRSMMQGNYGAALAPQQSSQAPMMPGATQATAPTTMATQPTAASGSAPSQQQAPAQGAPAASSSPALPGINPKVFQSVDPSQNPFVLQQQIDTDTAEFNRIKNGMQEGWGDPKQSNAALQGLTQRIDANRKTMNEILTGASPIVGPGADQANAAIQQYNNTKAANAKQMTETEVAARKDLYGKRNQFYSEDAPMLEQSLDAVQRMSMTTDTNKASQEMSNAIGYLRSIPWVRDNMPDSMAALQAAVETGNKSAIKQAFQDVQKGLQRAPSAALRAAMQAVANPELSPGARYNLITQSKANLYRDYDYYGGWDPNGQQTVGDYNKQFQTDKNHNINRNYTARAVAATPYFAGMQDSEKTQLGYLRNDDGTVVPTRVGAAARNAESTGRQGTGAPALPQEQVPKAPAAPANGNNIPVVSSPAEARKLPKGTVFRTPDGRMKVVP